jgi:hypothetical protein
MNLKLLLIRVTLIAAWVGTTSIGYGQEDVTAPVADSARATLQAESDRNRLVLTAQHLPWERVKEWGLIEDHRKNITAEIRAAVADHDLQVEATSSGFSLDLGPSEGRTLGDQGDVVLSLTLTSGLVASTPFGVRSDTPLEEPAEEQPKLHGGFCLGTWDRMTPLMNAQQQQAAMSAASAGSRLEFREQNGHLVLAMAGASWEEVEAVTVQAVKGHDYTTALREAILRGSAWVLPTADGFRLEIQDPDVLGKPAREVVLTLDTGDVVIAPISAGRYL